jgi:hypothetical protein
MEYLTWIANKAYIPYCISYLIHMKIVLYYVKYLTCIANSIHSLYAGYHVIKSSHTLRHMAYAATYGASAREHASSRAHVRMLHMSQRMRVSFMYTYPVSTFTSIQHHQDACACVCVCVVRERERERERVTARERECVCTPTVAPRSIQLLRWCSSMARCWSRAVMCCRWYTMYVLYV